MTTIELIKKTLNEIYDEQKLNLVAGRIYNLGYIDALLDHGVVTLQQSYELKNESTKLFNDYLAKNASL